MAESVEDIESFPLALPDGIDDENYVIATYYMAVPLLSHVDETFLIHHD